MCVCARALAHPHTHTHTHACIYVHRHATLALSHTTYTPAHLDTIPHNLYPRTLVHTLANDADTLGAGAKDVEDFQKKPPKKSPWAPATEVQVCVYVVCVCGVCIAWLSRR